MSGPAVPMRSDVTMPRRRTRWLVALVALAVAGIAVALLALRARRRLGPRSSPSGSDPAVREVIGPAPLNAGASSPSSRTPRRLVVAIVIILLCMGGAAWILPFRQGDAPREHAEVSMFRPSPRGSVFAVIEKSPSGWVPDGLPPASLAPLTGGGDAAVQSMVIMHRDNGEPMQITVVPGDYPLVPQQPASGHGFVVITARVLNLGVTAFPGNVETARAAVFTSDGHSFRPEPAASVFPPAIPVARGAFAEVTLAFEVPDDARVTRFRLGPWPGVLNQVADWRPV
jgi:hypothetical protein